MLNVYYRGAEGKETAEKLVTDLQITHPECEFELIDAAEKLEPSSIPTDKKNLFIGVFDEFSRVFGHFSFNWTYQVNDMFYGWDSNNAFLMREPEQEFRILLKILSVISYVLIGWNISDLIQAVVEIYKLTGQFLVSLLYVLVACLFIAETVFCFYIPIGYLIFYNVYLRRKNTKFRKTFNKGKIFHENQNMDSSYAYLEETFVKNGFDKFLTSDLSSSLNLIEYLYVAAPDEQKENKKNIPSWLPYAAIAVVLSVVGVCILCFGKSSGATHDEVIAKITGSQQSLVNIPDMNLKMLNTEVTQQLYTTVMESNPSYFKGDNLPVEYVSWYDAIYFCNKLSEKYGFIPVYAVDGKTDVTKWGYTPHNEKSIEGTITQNTNANGFRLPTNEEWEYAAKGGQNYTYAGSNNLDEVGWYERNSGGKTHPVAQKKPNGYGLYDMSGNVWEWCWDSDDDDYRYGRGGGYDNDGYYCEVECRGSGYADIQFDDLGFRIVCSPSK